MSDLAMGNLVGANVLNLTWITGTAAVISPFDLPRTAQLYSLPAMLTVIIVVMVMARGGRMLARWNGVALLSLYAAYIAGLAVIWL